MIIIQPNAAARPAPQQTSEAFGSTAWVYRKELSRGQKWTVRFDATTKKEGPVEGTIEIQVGMLPKSVPFRLRAQKPIPGAGDEN